MRKMKILAADDNPLTLQSLQTTIPWQEWGYELTACAQNGEDAWKKINLYYPDIVILDIHMPGMSGLEVAARIQEMENRPLVILLSAYDEFTYAKKGIRLGVFDYLLKPLDNGELKMVLDKAALSLLCEAHGNEKNWRKDWCKRLLAESTANHPEAIGTLRAYLSEEWHPYGYALLFVQLLEGNRSAYESFLQDTENMLSGEHVQQLNTELKMGSLILLGFSSLRLTRDYDLKALYLANAIIEIGKKHALQLCVGISNYAEQLDDPEKMFEEAKFAAQSRFFLENKSVIHYQSVMSKSVHNEYIMSKKMQELFYAVSQKNIKKYMESLDEFIVLFEKSDCYDVEYVRTIFIQIAFSVSSMADICCMSDQVKTMDTIQKEIQSITSMQSMAEWIREYARRCIEEPQQSVRSVSPQTKKTLDFLNMNYMKQVSLKDAAVYSGVSESHLCRLLKNETGETFVNILSKIRIQNAQQLIESGNYKVYEVAEQVGFSNYAYFYQVFRKMTGISPTEYQKK